MNGAGRIPAAILLLLGLLQMTGDIVDIPVLQGIGAASAASPAPKVFSSSRGFETFSSRFFIEWTASDGETRSMEVTSELYGRIRGPYNRRNVYGAVMAYGPVLIDSPVTRPTWEAVARYALCGGGPLRHELRIDDDARSVAVRYVPRRGGNRRNLATRIEIPCP
jgi:hypothetical protein